MKAKDYIGMTFNALTVESVSADRHGTNRYFLRCKCECGNYIDVLPYQLKNNSVKSCGCWRKKNHHKTHGYYGTSIYNVYRGILQRCYNKNNKSYGRYGGRGITVCKEWRDSADAFIQWAYDNGYEQGLSIDRIDVNGNYCPSNCRWTTMKAQSRNRRDTLIYTIDGVSRPLKEWCELYDVPYERTRKRVVNGGWDLDKALTTPSLR